MTRKDYILIAEALQTARIQEDAALNHRDSDVRGWTQHMFTVVTDRIANMLASDNPRFDREHFLAVVRGEKELNSRPSSKNTEPESLYGKRCASCGAHFSRNGACECLR